MCQARKVGEVIIKAYWLGRENVMNLRCDDTARLIRAQVTRALSNKDKAV